MAKQADVDYAQIRHFADNLKTFRSKVIEINSRLQGNLNRLSDSWQDQEFDNFAQAFASAQQTLRRFTDEIEQTLPKLERDAQRAEEIHNPKAPDFVR
jgi:WXG100 family type VII secretion target